MATDISNEIVQNPNQLAKFLNGKIAKLENEIRTLTNELATDHATFRTVVNDVKTLANTIRTKMMTRCIGAANFEIDTNYDIQNGDAFDIIVDGVVVTIATDQSFDTGTDTVIETNAYWAGALLSIDADSTTHVDWGAEADDEAGALAALSSVTASGDVVCGYVTVQAAAGQDFVAGTDSLETGTGGQTAQNTNYYNNIEVGDAAMSSAVSTSPPATIENSISQAAINRSL